ncbi:MAG: hypothetical protein DME01_24395 [Candidatus Rokuibacteriota bacterium]|nr:MAG: hypothetical protein DME01_24395 [Candidatus Rokubacteria bacterium]
MSAAGRFLRSQIAEIERDDALRWYGVAMAVVHVVTYLFWVDQRIVTFVNAQAEPICWPLVPACEQLRVLSAPGMALLLRAYFAAAIGAGFLFASRRMVPWAYAGLVLVNVLKLAIMLLDYRLRMNQHYMGLFAAFVYLLVPGKRDALRVLVTLFYFWAGTLKLNWEWISGAGLYRPMWPFSGAGVVAACVYVIVLELGVAWGLLAKRAWIFWVAFAQFLVFHALSWQVVGFFYPLLMFAILTIFPLSRLVEPRDPPDGPLVALCRGREVWSVYALAAMFSLLQLIPYAFPGDRTLTGQGRLYALHMFDARATCEGWADLHNADGTTTRRDLKLPLDTRIACDPIVYFNRARNLCRQRDAGRGAFEDLDLYLSARRASEGEMKRVIATKGFCAKGERYDPFRHNAWILTE